MSSSTLGMTKREIKDWVDKRFGPKNVFNLVVIEDFQRDLLALMIERGILL